MPSREAVGGSMGLTSTLTVIFIVLKLLRMISWSWWWVVSPLIFDVILLVAVLGIGSSDSVLSWWSNWRTKRLFEKP